MPPFIPAVECMIRNDYINSRAATAREARTHWCLEEIDREREKEDEEEEEEVEAEGEMKSANIQT